MHYEIENKFRCDDVEQVRQKLLALGAEPGEVLEQADCYYKHPVRDFAKTDEAFRLRQVGPRNYITYKGPKLDAQTKSRHEEEVQFADGEAARTSCDEIFHRLGFETVAVVRKQRQPYHLTRDGRPVEVALDQVDQVGRFVEIEISVNLPEGDQRPMDEAKQTLATLAAELGLTAIERRSYLELLLASHAT